MFDFAFELVVGLEGGFVDHKDDKGGATKYGITKLRYPNEDIPNLTIERAKFLYKRDFWDRFKIDLLPEKYRIVVFDMYVNHSPRATGLVIQRAINSKAGFDAVVVDGSIGNNTIGGLTKYKPELFRVHAFRAKYYSDIVRNNPSQIVFYVGWINRILKLNRTLNETGRRR